MDASRVYTFGRSRLTVGFGDLILCESHVLVSSDDFYLTMDQGLSGAIRIAAGGAIALDVAKHVPAKLGEVVVTTAGSLPARYVFHAVTIGPGALDVDPVDTVRRATQRCLDLMAPLGVHSLTFPALGIRTAGYTIDEAAATMTEVIVADLQSRSYPVDVAICLYAPERLEPDFFTFYENLARAVPALNTAGPARSSPTVEIVAPPPTVRDVVEQEHLEVQRQIFDLDRERDELERRFIDLRQAGASTGEIAQLKDALKENLDAKLDHTVEEDRLRRKGVGVFICYARKDMPWKERLLEHLAGLRREGLVTIWHDGEIPAGEEWDSDIREQLETARIILLLLSASFMSSDYINRVELQVAMQRHMGGTAQVIPIIVRDVDWRYSPLGALQALPRDGRSLAAWGDAADQALVEVVEAIRDALHQLGQTSASSG